MREQTVGVYSLEHSWHSVDRFVTVIRQLDYSALYLALFTVFPVLVQSKNRVVSQTPLWTYR